MNENCTFCRKKDNSVYYNGNLGYFHKDCMRQEIKNAYEDCKNIESGGGNSSDIEAIMSFVLLYDEILEGLE